MLPLKMVKHYDDFFSINLSFGVFILSYFCLPRMYDLYLPLVVQLYNRLIGQKDTGVTCEKYKALRKEFHNLKYIQIEEEVALNTCSKM